MLGTRAGGVQLRVVAADHLNQPQQAAMRQLSRLLREAVAIAALFTALILLLALLSFHSEDPGWSHTGGGVIHNRMGRAGAWFADVSLYLFGFMAYLIPALLFLWGGVLFRAGKRASAGYRPLAIVRLAGVIMMLIATSGLADLHLGVPEGRLPDGSFGGGVLGTATAWWLVAYLHPLGTTLLLLAVFFCSLTLAFGTSWIQLIEGLGAVVLHTVEALGSRWRGVSRRLRERRRRQRADRRRVRRVMPPVPGLPTGGGPRFVGTLAAALRSLVGWRGAPRTEEADPLLDAVPDTAHRGGLAAALELARRREQRRDPERDAVLGSRSPDRFDVAADALGGAASAVSDPHAAPVERPSEPGNAVAADTASEPPAVTRPRRRKPSIKPRAVEQQQAKLFLDVPDSDLPPLSLLDLPEPQRPGFTHDELEALSRLLEDKLAEFRIVVEVVAVHPGPVITRFEMQPAPGIKASRITNLSQDIARSMSLPSVRVVEVIPGKSTIGIEVPNDRREIVQLSEMLRSDAYVDARSPLTLALGKDISGQPVTADLARMPHLLVAGTTGSGKSVAVNAMLISLLYKSTAKDVRLILIDPKMLELNVYDDIPHLLSPVVTDMKEASNALRWCVGEMERRYMLMAELKVRNLAGYNRKIREAESAGTPIVDPLHDPQRSLEPTAPPPTLEPMPTIVVVVDEFADMMMQVGKKAEEMIARIAQKARAAGIHLILATQRPSVDVITGLIKANVPTRIAFQVSQKVDSRTILDQGGAESLLGHGDMLYLPPGTAVPIRVHGAFVDDHEVHNVVSHIKQSGSPNYIEEILHESSAPIPGLSGGSEDTDGEHDALYDQAVAIVCESRKASISYVQRRLKIGYNRAARMIEEMEASGVVSTVTANGSREVLAPPPVQ